MATSSKFEAITWLRETDAFPALRDELLALAGDEPDESTRYEGMVDFHWGFAKLADAERMAAALTPLTSPVRAGPPAAIELRQSRCVGYIQGRALLR